MTDTCETKDVPEQFTKEFGCSHQWGRRSARRGLYLNGAGWCRKCDAFRGSMFQPVVLLGHLRKPLTRWEREYLEDVEENADGMNEHMDAKYPHEAVKRRKYARQLRVRFNLFGATEAFFASEEIVS